MDARFSDSSDGETVEGVPSNASQVLWPCFTLPPGQSDLLHCASAVPPKEVRANVQD